MKDFFDGFKEKLTRRAKYLFIALAILILSVVIATIIPKVNDGVSKITDTVFDKVNQEEEAKELRVHYFNVDQGDCQFIELPNGKTILIDAGERNQGPKVVDKIEALGYDTIDYVIATHPHSDHIGGLIDVYNAFDIKATYMPNCVHTTQTYEDFITCVENEKCKVVNAFAGVEMISSDNLNAYFVAPNSEAYEKINNYSACLMLKYGENSFLFMGDAEQESEYEISGDLTCDVVKIGHHGSNTSSSYNFVTRTKAKYGVIQCGVDNDYGHPHDKSLNTWKENGTIVFRTDLNGDILFISNGKLITYQNQYAFKNKEDVKRNPEVSYDGVIESDNDTMSESTTLQQSATPNVEQDKEEVASQSDATTTTYSSKDEYKFVVNTYRKKIHYPNCESVDQMSPQNKKYTNKSVKELKKEGYSPCGNCRPSD